MPAPPPESEFGYRSKARGHVGSTRKLLSSDEPRNAIYACLELRMAIEALSYEAFQSYTFEVSAAAMDKWTPKQIMDELLYIDPEADQTSTISIEFPGTPTTPAFKFQGENRRLSAKWANKVHNALGSFLHQPTVKQLKESPQARENVARDKAFEALEELDRILASPIWGFRGFRLVEIKCECGSRIARDFDFLAAGKDVTCSGCGRIYMYTFEAEQKRFCFKVKMAKWSCRACATPNLLPYHEAKSGNVVECASCRERYKISMVPQLAKLETPPKEGGSSP